MHEGTLKNQDGRKFAFFESIIWRNEMRIRILSFLLLLIMALPLTSQTATKKVLSELTPKSAAQVIELTLGHEGHPSTVKDVKTTSGWDFEIDLKKKYDTISMMQFLGTMVGAVATATRYTNWKSNKVYMKTSGIKFAWITTAACRKLMRKMESGEYDSDTLLIAVTKEIHRMI